MTSDQSSDPVRSEQPGDDPAPVRAEEFDALAAPDLDPVEDFWSATALEPWNVAAFWTRISRPAPQQPILAPLASHHAGQPLPPVDDDFQRRLASRRSGREFADEPLSRIELARLLAAAGVDSAGRRLFPRAGDFDSVHLYVLARRVEGCGWGTAWRYDHDSHALVPLGPQPVDHSVAVSPEDFDTMCSLTPGEDPAAVVVFVVEPGMTIARYGIHGQRFGLQEVGHAMQNLLLRMSEDGLTGYPMGGLVDSMVLGALGLANMGVRIGGGLTVGRRTAPPRRRRSLRRQR